MASATYAEQAVLGSILLDPRCFAGVLDTVEAADFDGELNRNIFVALTDMLGRGVTIDPLTLLDHLKSHGNHGADTNAYVKELISVTPTSANAPEYSRIVRENALLRGIAQAGMDITAMAADGKGGAQDVLDAAEQRVYSLRRGRSGAGLVPIGDILPGAFDRIGAAAQTAGSITGASTGLLAVDYMIMGLNRSDLVILAARPGVGKTSLAMQIGLTVAKTQGAVAVFSLEMSREQLALRLLSGEAKINGRKLQTGQLNAAEWARLSESAITISAAKMLINDNPSLSVAEMNAQCRRVDGLSLVIIDYLQLMQGGNGRWNENRVQAVSEMSRSMKIMAKELNVPVLCLSQLSRENVKRADKRPLLSDLRESGSIEQDADVVLGLYLADDAERHNIAECIVLKNRRGETGTVELLWKPETTSFAGVEVSHE
jgi:replicative DNA helicase